MTARTTSVIRGNTLLVERSLKLSDMRQATHAGLEQDANVDWLLISPAGMAGPREKIEFRKSVPTANRRNRAR